MFSISRLNLSFAGGNQESQLGPLMLLDRKIKHALVKKNLSRETPHLVLMLIV